MIKSIKKILVAFNVSFETYIGYSGLNDEQQKKSFLSNLVEGGHSFFEFFKGGYLKNV